MRIRTDVDSVLLAIVVHAVLELPRLQQPSPSRLGLCHGVMEEELLFIRVSGVNPNQYSFTH